MSLCLALANAIFESCYESGINADHHPVMQRFHKPEDEKRSVVIADLPLPWLLSSKDARAGLLIAPRVALEAHAAPRA